MEQGADRAGEQGAELERLQADLDEARQQLEATTEVLTTVARSPADSRGVLASLVETARRLIRAEIAQIHLIEGDWYRLASSSGLSEEYLDFVRHHPIAMDRQTLIGRVGLERQAQQIRDVLADSEYGRQDIQEIGGYRSILGVPMILDEEIIGVLSAWRTEVDPFPERAIQVLTTFAAQAAIVIRNADLVSALESGQSELEAKVDQLEALGEIGQAVSSSLDLDQVLTKIVTHAVELTEADGGSVFEFDELSEEFYLRTTFGTSRDTAEALQAIHMKLRETLVGRAALQRKSLQIPDLRLVDCDPHLAVLLSRGWISVIAVPILRDQQIIGALVIRRKTEGGFSEELGELLETFAGQSAVAIVNARLYAELARKSAHLEVASRYKSEFIASMSHELRTPLNAVIGFSEVLLQRMFGDINDKQEEYLQDILVSGRHLLALLNDILDMSKADAGVVLEPSVFEVRPALEECILWVSDKAGRRGLRIERDYGEEVETIRADEKRFKQVIGNLLSNAGKFARSHIEVSAHNDGDMLTVAVSDDGLGIAPEDQGIIFEPFQQGKRPSREEGTGLGLALCRQYIGLHQGDITVQSELGHGSTFTVTFPLDLPPSQPEEAATGDAVPAGPVVAIVEDDPRSRELLCLYVEKVGVGFVTASDGREGLDLIRRADPVAVVLDIQLPTLDGWDLLALLKADPHTAAIPVVVVSMVDERSKGLALGAAEYLVKPVRGEELRAALRRVTGRPQGDRVLVAVGEDPDLPASLQAALEPEGWTVLSARDEVEGEALVRQNRPAVVLVDLLGTGTSGLALVEALRNNHLTEEVPIIALAPPAMTAHDKERLQGQIDLINRNGEFDVSKLVDVVHRATHHVLPPRDA